MFNNPVYLCYHCLMHVLVALSNRLNLFVIRCGNLDSLPDSMGLLTALKHLDMSECKALMTVPSSLGDLFQLETLNLRR